MKSTAFPADLRNTQQSGVILLTISILDMPSYTHAVKAQRLLRSRGYPCRIKRREKSSERGCGYSVHITGNSESAISLLESNNIPYSVISGGGEGDDQL